MLGSITGTFGGALIVLLAAAPHSRADAPSDLRANQEFPQQRLDQLAQVGTAKPNLPPGTASIAGSFPRSFLLPGTDTSIQIGGFVDLSAAYFISAGGNNASGVVPPVVGGPLAASLPLPGTAGAARQYGWFRMNAPESRLFVETRTPTAWGEASTRVEFDFFGCVSGNYCNDLNTANNPDVPRLRLAYGTLGGFIAGQTWVPGLDLQAGSETVDFGGDVGGVGWARAPQIGYKTAVAWLGPGATAGVYAVQPYTQIATPIGAYGDASIGIDAGSLPIVSGGPTFLTNIAKTFTPDGALVLNWEQPWGHLQLHGVIEPIELNDGAFISRRYIGYGGGVSGAVNPGWFGWAKDHVGFQLNASEGGGHWIASGGSVAVTQIQPIATNYGQPGFYGNGGPMTAAAAAAIHATTVTAWGVEVNYQHWWRANLRSTVSFGAAHQDLPLQPLGRGAIPANYNKETETAHLNIIWSPVPFVDTGVEYIYDHRDTVLNKRADGHVIAYDFKVKF